MPPTLDLSHSTHAKMMVAPPRLNLRRAASYQHDKAPLSSTSSRFNFNHLIFSSPPPSPGLPALVPQPRKSPTTPRPSRILRLIAWIAGLFLLLFVARSLVKGNGGVQVVGWAFEDQKEYEMVGQYDLPDFPTPIAVTDQHGRSKWTVSIPPAYEFPLTVKEYTDMCAKCQEVAAHVRDLHGGSSQQPLPDYYYKDPYFLDVGEAQERGLLPGIEDKAWRVTAEAQDGHLVGTGQDSLLEKDLCKTSLTFVLESPDAGLGSTLMMLWIAYGLAQKERRAFFIDDSRWPYGEYTAIFKAPPNPDCNPPPRYEMLPCPHTARHLVVSPATARDTFGASFNAKYENHERSDITGQRPMYDLARAGYEALFGLNDEDQPYVESRVKELKEKAKVPQGGYHDGTVIGIHIRHGDVHPYEYQYNGAYMPVELFTQKGTEIIEDRHNSSTLLGGEDVAAKEHSFMLVASDDPDVYETEVLSNTLRAQERIKLASKQHIQEANADRHVMHKFVDETFGWEGGFFATMFWNLGRSTMNNDNAGEQVKTPLKPSAETMRLRGLIGRAYMMDLAVVGQASDTIICTMSAMGCRLMAVMMGWEEAMDKGNWINIDGNYQWAALSI